MKKDMIFASIMLLIGVLLFLLRATGTAYFESVGRKIRNASPLDPYAWNSNVVVGILENRQYTGCAVNFKTTTVSYKVHKKIINPVEDYQIIPNMQ